MTEHNPPAFPGTLLDYFAGQAIEGVFQLAGFIDLSYPNVAADVYDFAEAMVAESAKRNGKAAEKIEYAERCPNCGGTEHVPGPPGTVGPACVRCCGIQPTIAAACGADGVVVPVVDGYPLTPQQAQQIVDAGGIVEDNDPTTPGRYGATIDGGPYRVSADEHREPMDCARPQSEPHLRFRVVDEPATTKEQEEIESRLFDREYLKKLCDDPQPRTYRIGQTLETWEEADEALRSGAILIRTFGQNNMDTYRFHEGEYQFFEHNDWNLIVGRYPHAAIASLWRVVPDPSQPDHVLADDVQVTPTAPVVERFAIGVTTSASPQILLPDLASYPLQWPAASSALHRGDIIEAILPSGKPVLLRMSNPKRGTITQRQPDLTWGLCSVLGLVADLKWRVVEHHDYSQETT